jgi:hypothetical protein
MPFFFPCNGRAATQLLPMNVMPPSVSVLDVVACAVVVETMQWTQTPQPWGWVWNICVHAHSRAWPEHQNIHRDKRSWKLWAFMWDCIDFSWTFTCVTQGIKWEETTPVPLHRIENIQTVNPSCTCTFVLVFIVRIQNFHLGPIVIFSLHHALCSTDLLNLPPFCACDGVYPGFGQGRVSKPFFFKMFSLVTFGSHNILDPLVILFVIALLLTFSAPCPKRENARNSRHVVS